MKILYDVSWLGSIYHSLSSKSGIFRVVENLAYELSQADDIDLICCTSGTFFRLATALNYMRSNEKLASLPSAYTNKDLYVRKLVANLIAKADVEVRSSTGFNQIAFRALRKSSHFAANIFYEPIDAQILSESEIYHSPFEEIPDQVRKKKHLQKFLTVHDLIPVLYPNFFSALDKNPTLKALKSLDPESWILCVSQATKEDLCEYLPHISPDRMFVTYLAASGHFYPCADLEKFKSVREKYGIPDAPYILSLSTLEPRKNIEHAIQCFFKLIKQENIQDLNFVLAGGKGWNYDSIFSKISNESHLKDRVIVTGYVADEDLAALYSHAIAFVYVSFYEGFGLPPLEAMQCGTPVITSNTSSLPEVVGDAGFMISPSDSDALCEKVLRLYSSSRLREASSLKCLQQAKKFSWQKCASETISAYKTALSNVR